MEIYSLVWKIFVFNLALRLYSERCLCSNSVSCVTCLIREASNLGAVWLGFGFRGRHIFTIKLANKGRTGSETTSDGTSRVPMALLSYRGYLRDLPEQVSDLMKLQLSPSVEDAYENF